jgi:hypothetical protein
MMARRRKPPIQSPARDGAGKRLMETLDGGQVFEIEEGSAQED